jgi:hypothetical protein
VAGPAVTNIESDVSTVAMISLTDEDLKMVPAEFSEAKFNPEIGGYMAGVEAVHQLHCLVCSLSFR